MSRRLLFSRLLVLRRGQLVSLPGLAAPIVTAIANQTGVADSSAFSLQAANTGGAVETWSLSGAPAGFTISSTGLITGTKNTVATSTITVTATNATGSNAKSFTLTISAVAGGTFLDIDFKNLSALPSGFSLNRATASFSSAGTKLSRDSSTNSSWGVHFMTGPRWDDSQPLNIYFKGMNLSSANGNSGWGISHNPLGWLQRIGAADTLVGIRNGAYLNEVNLGDYPTQSMANVPHRMEFVRAGANVTLTLYKDNGAGGWTLVHTVTVPNASTLSNAFMFVEVYNYNDLVLHRLTMTTPAVSVPPVEGELSYDYSVQSIKPFLW